MHVDVNAGMIFSNAVAFFIIVTTAVTLGAHGKHDISSAQDAARALEPLAGHFAALLFTLGMVGTGLLAIPALLGSSEFYAVLVAAILMSMAIVFFRANPISALFYSAVINGVVAVPLVAVIVILASSRAIMGRWRASTTARAWGWLTVVVMTLTAVGMFAFMHG